MYKLTMPETVKHKVIVQIPGDMGRSTKSDFILILKCLKLSEKREYFARIDEQRKACADTDQLFDDQDFLMEMIVDWEGVAGEDGSSLPCTSENLCALLDISYVRSAVSDAVLAELSGVNKLKN